jgi:predicted RNase H-like HicB family nuclease
MSIAIELEREDDGRWLAEVPALPGVVAYGTSREEALRAVQTLALRVIADRLEQGEPVSDAMLSAFHVAA